jgi:hypothetical protein
MRPSTISETALPSVHVCDQIAGTGLVGGRFIDQVGGLELAQNGGERFMVSRHDIRNRVKARDYFRTGALRTNGVNGIGDDCDDGKTLLRQCSKAAHMRGMNGIEMAGYRTNFC